MPSPTASTRRLAAVALALGLAASAALAQRARLVVWMVGDDKTPRVMQPAVDAYRARHPDVDIEVRDVPWADAMTKYSAALASRRGPDLVTGSTSYAIALGAKGALVDLAEAAPDLAAELQRHANPGALQAIRRADGRLYGAPFDMHVQLQYYRSDLLDKAPADWDGFIVTARALRARGHGIAQQWGNTSWLGFYPYLRQAGGAVYDASCRRAVIDSPEAVQALAYYARLYRELQAPTDGWPDADGGLESGAYGLMQSGTWLLSRMDMVHKGLAGKWAAAPLPAGPTGRRTAVLGGTVLAVMHFSPRRELALDFMRTVYSPEVSRRMAEAALAYGGMWLPSGRQDQIAHLSLPFRDALLAQLADAEGPPPCPAWMRQDYLVTRAVQRVVLAGGDPRTELGHAAAVMNRALEAQQ
ncbi:extracellular solute-binding protein [Pelomonas sp. P7]|uniref:Extracellular solute-binding protein n=1 Tax=Pelomonas caseinilytica TaxID=2906763 RepID=A0ABS8XNR2_9BURK|nr:extracellular solute-binding protein [Pelomonas sp. P7]MCE4540283.1 extracellular solute-binding protein [Pelomonas sp. P7]